MQLVDYQIHHDTGHTGGYKIWGKDREFYNYEQHYMD
ncbi:HNH endonuclease [Bacillus toyonensis]|nr:HNH endonuclease [Bacillus toyonensis]MCU5176823.1 HNH endonuclease [Bacillus toyonensis]MDF9447798.1 HNH endonuclease [Bacillus toyonensis]